MAAMDEQNPARRRGPDRRPRRRRSTDSAAKKAFRDGAVSAVADALNRGAYGYEAVALVRQLYAGSPLWGRPCHWRTAFTIIRRARDLLIARAGSTREAERALSYGFYAGVIRDPKVPLGLKIKAQGR